MGLGEIQHFASSLLRKQVRVDELILLTVKHKLGEMVEALLVRPSTALLSASTSRCAGCVSTRTWHFGYYIHAETGGTQG